MAVAQKVIYAAYENDTPVYVGRTSRGLSRRVAEHLHDAVDNLTGPTKFHEWLRANLDAEFRVLEELPDAIGAERLAAREAWWIRELRPALNSAIPHGFYLSLDLLGGVQ